MKKWFALIGVAALLCAAVMPVNAAVVSSVRMDGPVQATVGETVAVALYVQGELGGVQGDITYDPTKLDYVGVTLRNDVVALGNTEDVTVNADETAGKVRFVCLSNVNGGAAPADAWLTLNFTVLMDVGEQATVTIADLETSDMIGGTVQVTNKATAITVVDTSDLPLSMEGATIRTSVEKQGIRFESKKAGMNFAADDVAEAGVLMFPTVLLYDGQDLCHDTIGKGNSRPAIAKTTDAADIARILNGESLFATLTNGTTDGRGNVAITARSYVKFTDGSVVYYSHNDNTQTDIKKGEASKTLVGVAQKIAAAEIDNGAPDTLDGLEDKATALTDAEVLQLLTFCRDNYGWL